MIIYDFKKGDEITRVKPAKPYSNGSQDRSYMGVKLIFVGIANGQIYLKRTDEFSLRIFGDKLVDLPVDLWDENWENLLTLIHLLKTLKLELINQLFSNK